MIQDALEEYITRQLEVLGLMDCTRPGNSVLLHMRVVGLRILGDLAFAALSPTPRVAIVDIVLNIRANIEGRPMHYDSDTALSSNAKAGQVVFRYQKQVADELTQMLADCSEKEDAA